MRTILPHAREDSRAVFAAVFLEQLAHLVVVATRGIEMRQRLAVAL